MDRRRKVGAVEEECWINNSCGGRFFFLGWVRVVPMQELPILGDGCSGRHTIRSHHVKSVSFVFPPLTDKMRQAQVTALHDQPVKKVCPPGTPIAPSGAIAAVISLWEILAHNFWKFTTEASLTLVEVSTTMRSLWDTHASQPFELLVP